MGCDDMMGMVAGIGWAGTTAAALVPLLALAAAVAAVAILMWRNSAFALPTPRPHPVPPPAEGPTDILKERYARGEIDHEEFERRLDVLMRNDRD